MSVPSNNVARDRENLDRFRAYRATHDPVLRDQLVCENLPLVHTIARKYRHLGEPMDDLIQEGAIGLINALDLFDPDRGVRFSTFACHLITRQIQHYLRDCGHLIRQPAWIQELNAKITRTTRQLADELGRDPTPAQIAERLNLTEESVVEVLNARELNRIVSLSAPSDHPEENELLLIDKAKIRARRYSTLQLPIEDRIQLQEAIGRLKVIEQKVVRLFFYEELNQSEIARKLGISVNYSSYLLHQSLDKMKANLHEQHRQERVLLESTETQQATVHTVPTYDPVTGLYADSYLKARIAEEIARSRRYALSFALMLVAMCDTDGMLIEEESALAAASQVLRMTARNVDLVAHQGNGRFALLLPHTGREARVLGDRLSAQFARREVASSHNGQTLGMVIGYSVFPPRGAAPDDMLACAEQALTQALVSGAGSVVYQPVTHEHGRQNER